MPRPVPRIPLPHREERADNQAQDASEAVRRGLGQLQKQAALQRVAWFKDTDASASATTNDTFWAPGVPIDVKRVYYITSGSHADDTTDYATLQIQAIENTGAGGIFTVAERDNSQLAISANRPFPLTIENSHVPANHSVRARVLKTGAGQQLSIGRIWIEYEVAV